MDRVTVYWCTIQVVEVMNLRTIDKTEDHGFSFSTMVESFKREVNLCCICREQQSFPSLPTLRKMKLGVPRGSTTPDWKGR